VAADELVLEQALVDDGEAAGLDEAAGGERGERLLARAALGLPAPLDGAERALGGGRRRRRVGEREPGAEAVVLAPVVEIGGDAHQRLPTRTSMVVVTSVCSTHAVLGSSTTWSWSGGEQLYVSPWSPSSTRRSNPAMPSTENVPSSATWTVTRPLASVRSVPTTGSTSSGCHGFQP
jgi:hypothetical protein